MSNLYKTSRASEATKSEPKTAMTYSCATPILYITRRSSCYCMLRTYMQQQRICSVTCPGTPRRKKSSHRWFAPEIVVHHELKRRISVNISIPARQAQWMNAPPSALFLHCTLTACPYGKVQHIYTYLTLAVSQKMKQYQRELAGTARICLDRNKMTECERSITCASIVLTHFSSPRSGCRWIY